MNAPETINIEKYAEALNNLVGMDIGYLGESDENVNAIVEVIRAAKALENRVKELEKHNAQILSFGEEYEALARKFEADNINLAKENKKLIADRDLYRVSVADTVREIFGEIGHILDEFYSEAKHTNSVTCELMLEDMENRFVELMKKRLEEVV